MIVVLVHVRIKPEAIEAFREATLVNAEQSRREPGVAQFDAIQQQDDPTRFVLVEAYRSPAAVAAHKDTAHYQIWRDRVEALMAEPRVGVRYTLIATDDQRG